jgi:hypothetical protein
MKSFLKLISGFAFLFVFATSQLNAQKSATPKLLIGEWTKVGQSGHQINDTIILTKKLSDASELHPRWKFNLPDKLSQYFSKSDNGGAGVISVSQTFKWNYDKKTKLLKIYGSKADQYFKVVSKGDQTIKLICIK